MEQSLKNVRGAVNFFLGMGIFIVGGTVFTLEKYGVQQTLYLAIVIGVSALYVGAVLVYHLARIVELLFMGWKMQKRRFDAAKAGHPFPDDKE